MQTPMCDCRDPACMYCKVPHSPGTIWQQNFLDLTEEAVTRINIDTDEEDEDENFDVAAEEIRDEDQEDDEETATIGSGEPFSVEDEKKRKKNTEAARRCREKIKKTTDELERQVGDLVRDNEKKNQARIACLAMIENEIKKLKEIVARNPELKRRISSQSNDIVNKYLTEVREKRQRIDEQFEKLKYDD